MRPISAESPMKSGREIRKANTRGSVLQVIAVQEVENTIDERGP
jgi:hypothetical protein